MHHTTHFTSNCFWIPALNLANVIISCGYQQENSKDANKYSAVKDNLLQLLTNLHERNGFLSVLQEGNIYSKPFELIIFCLRGTNIIIRQRLICCFVFRNHYVQKLFKVFLLSAGVWEADSERSFEWAQDTYFGQCIPSPVNKKGM